MPRPELSTLRYPNLWQGCVGAWCPSQSSATGYRLFDDSGNGNHGTLTNMDPGTDWVPSGGKLALDFDGVNDFVDAGSSSILRLENTSWSISFWAKPALRNTYQGFVVHDSNVTQNPLYEFGIANNNKFYFFNATQNPEGAVMTGQWEFCTGVATITNASQFTLQLWQNAVVTATQTNVAVFGAARGQRLRFGVDAETGTGGGAWLQGGMDDIRIYNRVLTPSEIRLLYTGGRGAAYERSRGRKKAYVPGYRITAPSRIQTGSARTIDGTDTESLTRGLVGAWCPSLGASGFRLIDRSGNNNHGTLTNMDPGTSWVASGQRTSLAFVANSTNRIEIPDNLFFNNRTQFSFSAWFNLRAYTGSTAGNALFCRGQINTYTNDVNLMIDTSGLMFAQINNGSDGSSSFNMTSSYVLGTWAHAILTYNGNGTTNDDKVAIYLNGTSRTLTHSYTVPSSTSTIASNTTFRIAQYLNRTNDANEWCFNGFLDDLRLYNRVLTPQEIRLLYTGGRGVGLLPEAKPKRARIVAWDNQDKISVPARVLTNTDSLKRGLVGHWSPSVSGPQGNRLIDLSGQNNHGTLTNMDYQTDYVPSTDKGGRMALDFDYSDDYIAINTLPVGTVHTTSAWVFPTKVYFLYYFGGLNGALSGSNLCSLFVSGSGSETNITDFGYTQGAGGVSAGGFALTNKWSHLCSVRDNLRVQLYWNGSLVQTGNLSANESFNIQMIGGRTTSNRLYFGGGVDDFRIYNRVLTSNEIRLLAQSRMPERATPQRTRTVFYSSGLVSYLRRRTYNSILGSGVLS